MRERAKVMVALGLAGTCALAVLGASAANDSPTAAAAAILEATGVKGGLIVHLGCGDGRLTAALRANDSYIVHGLDPDAQNVESAREHIRSLGVYGQVSVEQLTGGRLPYAENLVNLLVADDMANVSMDEVMRVLAPNGVAYIRERGTPRKVIKPWPDEIDEWTHHLHGPDGNPVANDTVVAPPKHYQWLAGPLWLRSHDTDSSVSAVVSARGRIFYIVDEGPTSLPGDHALPDKWFLAARDAFNGVLLWKVPIGDWGWREWKDTWFTDRPDNLPVNLPRRLVAAGDRVYVTLGYHSPVSQLDAATGEVIQTYEGTQDTREMLCCEGVLILSVYREGRLKVLAVDTETAQLLWETESSFAGSEREYFPKWRRRGEEEGPRVDPALNPAADGDAVCLLDGQHVVRLDFETGKQLWRVQVEDQEPAARVGTLIIHDGVVLHADPDELLALSAETGERMWSHPKRPLGWLWFQWKDVFVIRELVWTWSTECDEREFKQASGTYRREWPLYLNGFDLQTGELKQQIPTAGIFEAPHHHRCYRNKATTRYILASRRGTEFVDLVAGKHAVHNWVRGPCHLGMLPANGLHYAPPHPCVCYINEKLNGFNALAPEIPQKHRANGSQAAPRFERGPAYGTVEGQEPAQGGGTDWPTYRHDAMRSGSTKAAVSEALGRRWSVKIGGKLSPPTVAGDRLFVSVVDGHHVVALSTDDGKKLWEFGAGGRVDTPPTYYRGAVLFGSADGWVYCLRAADGELIWRFRGAPQERRIGAFGQLESAWPVHGSVLVQSDVAYVVAGRSSHVDGGMRLYALDAASGNLIHEAQLEGPHMDLDTFRDNVTPDQGYLPDILQGDDQHIYMRHLAFDTDLGRQASDVERIRTLSGFMDGSYFKRAFWWFGRRQNWGRLIVHDDQHIYLVRMFDTLKCLDPDNYFTPGGEGYTIAARPRREFSQIKVANSESLNPTGTPLTVEAWVKAAEGDGVVLARGGSASGYALLLKGEKPQFAIRVRDEVSSVTAEESVLGRWVHLAGVLTEEAELQIHVDGELSASAEASGLIAATPGQAMEIGADAQTGVGDYESPFAFTGIIDEVRVYHRALSGDEIRQHHAQPGQARAQDGGLLLHFSFDRGDATDESGHGNDGQLEAVEMVEGKSGRAMQFVGSGGPGWSVRVPIRVRAMLATDRLLFVAGPPDVVDPKDPLASFEGRAGGMLWVFSGASGEKLAEYPLESPPVFNGIAAANGGLYMCGRDGRVLCMESSR